MLTHCKPRPARHAVESSYCRVESRPESPRRVAGSGEWRVCLTVTGSRPVSGVGRARGAADRRWPTQARRAVLAASAAQHSRL